MRRTMLVLAFLLLAAPARAQGDPKARASAEKHFKPVTKRDDFEKSVTTVIPLEDLPAYRSKDVECGTGNVHLRLLHTASNGSALAAVEFTYIAHDWMFIEKASPMKVLAGDSSRSFAPGGEPDQSTGSGMASETQEYIVTSDDLAWLASVPAARVRVEGEKGNCDFPLTAEALALAGLFNERVVRDSAEGKRND